jgi:hypothetical protein
MDAYWRASTSSMYSAAALARRQRGVYNGAEPTGCATHMSLKRARRGRSARSSFLAFERIAMPTMKAAVFVEPGRIVLD